MPSRIARLLLPLLTALALAVAFYLLLDVTTHSGDLAAYPPPQAPAATAPYPGPQTPRPTLKPAPAYKSPTPMSGLAHYLPVADRAVPFQFSVAGATPTHIDDLIDVPFGSPPYSWGRAPDPGRGTQMINRCNGGRAQHWCWIVPYPITDVVTGEEIRSNIAAISTPLSHPPSASSSSGTCQPFMATDELLGSEFGEVTHWVAGSGTTQAFTIDQLHEVRLEEIVIDWFTGSTNCGGPGVYATAYSIKVDWGTGWQTIYSTESGTGGTEVLTTNDFINYDNQKINAVVLVMMAKPASPAGNYAITELKVYGEVEDSLFNRHYTQQGYNADLAGWAQQHQGTIWLIGNEPDNYEFWAGDAMHPGTYGEFYGRMAQIIKEADPGAILAFCQGTAAETPPNPVTTPQFPHSWGWHYCKESLDEIAAELTGSELDVEDVIDVVSIHQYVIQKIDNQATREPVLAEWITHLEDFQAAINNLDGVADELIGKPLVLTEYGDYDNRCVPATPTPTPGSAGGPSGPAPTLFPTAAPGCGDLDEGTAWYGNDREQGYWALTYYATDYFLRTCLNNTGCNSQWVGAWWFYASPDQHQAARGSVIEDWATRRYNDTGTRLHEAIATTTCQRAFSCTPMPTPTP